MDITLDKRNANTVKNYFQKAKKQEIKLVLPQRMKTIEETLKNYEKTLLSNAASFGQTVYVNGKYVGDVWCYNIDNDPNCMLSFCIFESEYWSMGVLLQ